jgi:hypothetical protein
MFNKKIFLKNYLHHNLKHPYMSFNSVFFGIILK